MRQVFFYFVTVEFLRSECWLVNACVYTQQAVWLIDCDEGVCCLYLLAAWKSCMRCVACRVVDRALPVLFSGVLLPAAGGCFTLLLTTCSEMCYWSRYMYHGKINTAALALVTLIPWAEHVILRNTFAMMHTAASTVFVLFASWRHVTN